MSCALQGAIDMTNATEYMRVANLQAFYGESHVLHGIDFNVKRGVEQDGNWQGAQSRTA